MGQLPTLDRPTPSLLAGLGQLHQIQAEFSGNYDRLLKTLASFKHPTLVLTVYDAIPGLTAPLKTALSLLNDVITRAALREGFDILDLRELLNRPEDFSSVSPIEPSGQASLKLARAVSRWALGER